MFAGMTTGAWRAWLRNVFLIILVLCATWGALTVAVALATGQTLGVSSARACGLLWWVLFLYLAGFWLYGRLTAGCLLLDCGPSSARPFMLLIAAFYLFKAVWKLFTAGDEIIRNLSFGAFFLLAASGRLQISENGIWEDLTLLRWRKVVAYRWPSDATLVLQTKGLLGLSQTLLPVPLEKWAEIDALLRDRELTQVYEP
jgi:hypothetical protein